MYHMVTENKKLKNQAISKIITENILNFKTIYI